MNKADLVDSVALETEESKAVVSKVLNGIITSITNTLSEGGRVTLVGFGTFESVQRKARPGHNPQTGAKIEIPATVVPKFRPGKLLKDAVSSNSK